MNTQVRMNKKEDLERMIGRWKERQEETERNAEALHKKTKSYFVKIVSKAIKQDAEKHGDIMAAILNCMHCTVTITPEELGELSDLLSAHLEVKKKDQELAEIALKKHKNLITTYLLKYVLEDEKKNYVLMDQLNQFKGQLYPYA